MTRGKEPAKGIDIALRIARKRGRVMIYRKSPQSFATFSITGYGFHVVVQLQRGRPLHVPFAEIEFTYRDAINQLRTVPAGGPLSREFWLYSRYCGTRYFRVHDTTIEELDRDGRPLSTPGGSTGPAVPASAAATPAGTGGEEAPAPATTTAQSEKTGETEMLAHAGSSTGETAIAIPADEHHMAVPTGEGSETDDGG